MITPHGLIGMRPYFYFGAQFFSSVRPPPSTSTSTTCRIYHVANRRFRPLRQSSSFSSPDLSGAKPFRQHSLQDGTLKKKLRSLSPVLGIISGQYSDTDYVETSGLLGYDFLWADAEHAPAGPDNIARLILAAERRGMPTLVRIGVGYQDIIGHSQKFLVAGAQGIIFPQCESRADAEKIVKAVKFRPTGERGLAGERWNAWCLGEGGTLKDRLETCNANSIVAIAIESRKGMDALDDILEVKELDFVFVGPTDLSADLGLHGEIRHPDVVSKIEAIGSQVRAAGKSAGMLALNGHDYEFWRDRGFNVMCGVAHSMFVEGATSLIRTASEYEEGRSRN